MATKTTQTPAAAQLLVSISDLSMLNDIKKAISMLKGVTLVKKHKQKEYDITKTAGYREAMDDVKHGRVTHYDSVDDMFKSVLGEEAFSKYAASMYSVDTTKRSDKDWLMTWEQRTGQSVKDWIAEQESALQSNKSNSLT